MTLKKNLKDLLDGWRKKNNYAKKIEQITGVYPNQILIYQQAFLHKSLSHKNQLPPFENNERLEFLGDAILDAVISNYIYKRFPKQKEGYLTKLRSKLVSRKMLNDLGLKIGLKDSMLQNVEKASKSVYGDVLEALIGALFLDKGYQTAQKFIEVELINKHINIDELVKTETDFKSRVLEWSQKEKTSIDFKITESDQNSSKFYLAELIINQSVRGTGKAFTKKQAEQLAAEQFYSEIE